MRQNKSKEDVLAKKISNLREGFEKSLVGLFSKSRVAKFCEYPEDINYRKTLEFNTSDYKAPSEVPEVTVNKFKLRKLNSTEAKNVAKNLVSSYEKELFEGQRNFSMVVNKTDKKEKDVGVTNSASSRSYADFFGKLVSTDMFYRDVSVEKKASDYFKKMIRVQKDCDKLGVSFSKVFEMSKTIKPKENKTKNIFSNVLDKSR
jgi:hypothetical protein